MKSLSQSLLVALLALFLSLILGCGNQQDAPDVAAEGGAACSYPEVLDLVQTDDPCIWQAKAECNLQEFKGWNIDIAFTDEAERREPAGNVLVTGRCGDSQYCGYSNETTASRTNIAVEEDGSGFAFSSPDDASSDKSMSDWTIKIGCGSIIGCCEEFKSAQIQVGTSE